MLPPAALVGFVSAIDEKFGLAPDAEVTTEANPEHSPLPIWRS